MQHTASKPPVSVQDGNMATVEELCATLTRHLGLLSSHTMAADHAAAGGGGGATVDHSHVARVLFLLETAILEQVQAFVHLAIGTIKILEVQ